MTATPETLLTGLLIRYWQGQVSQEAAARLLGIRTGEFSRLAFGRLVDAVAWRYYLERFNGAFPECDPRARKKDSPDWRKSEPRMYTDEQLLKPPQECSLYECIRGRRIGQPLIELDMAKRSRPPRFRSPALAQAKGQQLIDTEQPALMTEGAEFKFAA